MATNTTMQLELSDIQGILLSAYAHLNEATYLFLKVDDVVKARQWLKRVHNEVSSAAPWPRDEHGKAIKPPTQVNIAFTYPGLQALGLPAESLASFSPEFQEGITGVIRSKLLGDTGDSEPSQWEIGGPTGTPIHIMLMLFADDASSLATIEQRYRDLMAEIGGLTEIYDQDASRLPDLKEHFGFRDGLSQPAIEGAYNAPMPGQDVIRAGEFILGYRNEYDLLPPMPTPDGLGKNGSYLVYRKLAQDVAAFNDFMTAQANGNPEQAEWIGAKLVGRWKSGAPLALTPNHDTPDIAADSQRNNNFTYAEHDSEGYATPLGSHIRRSNPRDSLEGEAQASLETVRRHRLLRRGRPYGPAFSPDTAAQPRGTLFIVLVADIKRQFEFVQQTWINDPKFKGLYNDKDPLAGDHDGSGSLTIQRWPVRKEVNGLPRFVTVKAAAYFFVPSLNGLAYIAQGN